MSCRYSRPEATYINDDGDPCKRDEYGDPTHHCTARRTCSVHIGADELTCPRCIGRTRSDIAWVRNLAALMPTEALNTGVDSEAANLAGPAANPAAWTERRVATRSHLAAWEDAGRITADQHLRARQAMEDDDEHHPYTVLGRWALMLAEDYGHDLPTLNLTVSADYLDRNLARVAHDDEQDFPLMAREIRKCRTHLEAVLRNSQGPERGAPCPDCTSEENGLGPRLVREYGHWCEGEDCARMHYDDDSADRWVCPKDRKHWRSHEDYERWIESRTKGRSA